MVQSPLNKFNVYLKIIYHEDKKTRRQEDKKIRRQEDRNTGRLMTCAL